MQSVGAGKSHIANSVFHVVAAMARPIRTDNKGICQCDGVDERYILTRRIAVKACLLDKLC